MSVTGLQKKIKKAFAGPADRVAVVRLEGAIGGSGRGRGGLNAEGIETELKRAFELDHLKAVALVINSPGGSPAQSELIAERIRQLATEKGIRVLAFCEDAAASGGYWIACAADEIFAARTSIVGSIGVVSAGFGLVDVINKVGIERRVYSAGENKSRLDPFSPEKEADIVWLKGLQHELHEAFIAWVKSRRGTKLVGTDEELFSGEVWIGKASLDQGLVDGIGVMRSVLSERYPDAEIEVIEPAKPLLTRIMGGQVSGATAVGNVVDGVVNAVERRAEWMKFGL